jgi:ERCC4-type nuclease
MYVDTRESASVIAAARTVGFIPMCLEVGDYSTDKVIVERKKLPDFIASTTSRAGEPPRIYHQLDNMFAECERTQRIPLLFITGRLTSRACPKCGFLFEGAEADFNKRLEEHGITGIKFNRNSVFGACASVWVRYNINIIWTEQPIQEWMVELKYMLEKVDEGKYQMPQRRQLKTFSRDKNTAVLARTFDLPPKKAEVLAKNIGGLYAVLDAARNNPRKLTTLTEINDRTLAKIKDIAGIT